MLLSRSSASSFHLGELSSSEALPLLESLLWFKPELGIAFEPEVRGSRRLAYVVYLRH